MACGSFADPAARMGFDRMNTLRRSQAQKTTSLVRNTNN
jgi:hypothetical protein